MSYEEAFKLHKGDKVTVIETQEQRIVDSISGTMKYLFILLDNGYEYPHNQLKACTSS